MKRKWKQLGLLSLLLLLLVSLAGCGTSLADENTWQHVQQTKTITWGVKADTRLFGLMDVKDSQIKGFDVDIAKAVTQQMLGKNSQAKFVQVTSNTRVPMLKSGNIDAIAATMSVTKEREKQVAFSDTYFQAGQALLVKKGSRIHSVKDLKKGDVVIGVQGSDSVENIKKAAPQAKVIQLSDASQAFTALKAGQGVAMTSDNAILYGMSTQDNRFVVTGGSFFDEPYAVAANKGQTEFTDHVNTALKQLVKNGEYQRIVQKWFGNVPGFKASDATIGGE
ncbi:transporter substrate-binding domain-containing protein [Lactobacillus selangorensis]|nr:transporter substrate-binding domain-containing protein [Lactobacillus selangorensis]